jgi:tetrahydromethanopterin S-methyltransferase subunit G
MADEPENLVLHYLRRLDEKVDRLIADVRELKGTQTGMLEFLAAHDGRLTRIEDRLDRIERRLDLHDPAFPGG